MSAPESFSEAFCTSQFVHKNFQKSGRREIHISLYFLPFHNRRNNILETKHSDIKQKIPYKLPITKVYSDASNSGIGACFEIKGKTFYAQKLFYHKKM